MYYPYKGVFMNMKSIFLALVVLCVPAITTCITANKMIQDPSFKAKNGVLIQEFTQASGELKKTSEHKEYRKADYDSREYVLGGYNVIPRHQAIKHYRNGSLPFSNIVYGKLKRHDFKENCDRSIKSGNRDTKECDLFKEMEKIFKQRKKQAEENRAQKLREAYNTEAGRKYREVEDRVEAKYHGWDRD